MKLSELATTPEIGIIDVKNTGSVSTEFVSMTVNANCDIGDYLLTDTTYNELLQPSNKHRHVYFFPPHEVKKGDIVFLYSYAGENSVGKGGAGTYHVHRFYWNLRESVWNKTGDLAYLIKAPREQRIVHKIPPA